MQLSVKNNNDFTFSNSQDHRQPPPMGSGSNQRHDGGQATHGTPVGQSKYSGLVNEDLLASQSSRRPLTLAPTIPCVFFQ